MADTPVWGSFHECQRAKARCELLGKEPGRRISAEFAQQPHHAGPGWVMEEGTLSGIRRRGERQQAWQTQGLAWGLPGVFHPPKGDLLSLGSRCQGTLVNCPPEPF